MATTQQGPVAGTDDAAQARGARVRESFRAADVAARELRARVHVPVAGGRDLQRVRAGVRGGWAADDLEHRDLRDRAAARGARVRGDRRAVPGRGRDLPVGQTADRAKVGLADRLDLRLGTDRHGRECLHRRRGVRRLAVRVHAHPHHHRVHRGRPDDPVPADQPERHEDTRPRGDGRVRGRADRRARRGPVAADLRAPPRLQRVLRRARHPGRRQLPRRVPGGQPARPLPVLRLRGLRRRGRGGAGPGRDDPEGDAPDDLRRRRGGAADHGRAHPRPARLQRDHQRRERGPGGHRSSATCSDRSAARSSRSSC